MTNEYSAQSNPVPWPMIKELEKKKNENGKKKKKNLEKEKEKYPRTYTFSLNHPKSNQDIPAAGRLKAVVLAQHEQQRLVQHLHLHKEPLVRLKAHKRHAVTRRIGRIEAAAAGNVVIKP
jgi:hypothetical protein